MGENYANIFYLIMSAISPIAVALLGFYQTRKEKRDKSYREYREENERLRMKEEEKYKQTQEERLQAMENSMEKLCQELNELRKDVDIQKVEKQLNQLHILNEFNFEYIQSLSSVVLVMGETISSSDLLDEPAKQRLQTEVMNHKHKEAGITNKLYKVIA